MNHTKIIVISAAASLAIFLICIFIAAAIPPEPERIARATERREQLEKRIESHRQSRNSINRILTHPMVYEIERTNCWVYINANGGVAVLPKD